MIGQRPCPPAVATHEIGIAELTNRFRAILFATGPQIAARETDEHRRPPNVRALALKRVEDFFHSVIHAVTSVPRPAEHRVAEPSPSNFDRRHFGPGAGYVQSGLSRRFFRRLLAAGRERESVTWQSSPPLQFLQRVADHFLVL